MTRGNDELDKLTVDELRMEMQRCAGKDIKRRALVSTFGFRKLDIRPRVSPR